MDDYSFAPEPSEAAEDTYTKVAEFLVSDKWQRMKLEGFVLITALLLSSMLILRSLRHRTGWSFTKFCLRSAAYLSMHALSYVFGLLSETRLLAGLVVVWAVILVVLSTTTYSVGSDSLEENEYSRKRFLWDKLILSVWFVMLLLFNLENLHFLFVLVILWMLNILRLGERTLALISACRSRVGLDRVTMVVADYMRTERNQTTTEVVTPNPTTMEGYKYLVGVDQALDQVYSGGLPDHDKPLELKDITTVESVWQSEGRLLKEGDPKGHLKDTCLSFAMFWLLLRRFADYKLYEVSTEVSREKSWNFIRYGLIKEQEDGEESERAFRVVKEELSFLYQYLYENNFAVYSKGFRFLVVRLMALVMYLVIAFVTLVQLRHAVKKSAEKHPTQVKVTQVIIATISIIEITHAIDMLTSKWIRVKMICSYVQGRWWEPKKGNWARLKEMYLSLICRPAPFVCHLLFSSSKRTLRQVSLLDSYRHTPKMLWFRRFLEGYIDLPIVGQKEKKPPVDLSRGVKKAVIMSLQTNGPRLSRGVASLGVNNVGDELSWACKSTERTTRIILIWHIATSMCEINSKQSPTPVGKTSFVENLEVATSLSKYCVYLVAMAPKLLPDHVYVTQWLYEQAVLEAREKLNKCKSKKSKYERLMGLSEESVSDKTLDQGARLGKHLINKMKDADLRWKVLADFWAELILFLAPCDDPSAHAQYLVTGGEFITELWALLTHAGIVDRDPDCCGD